jgi:hypothetical protein
MLNAVARRCGLRIVPEASSQGVEDNPLWPRDQRNFPFDEHVGHQKNAAARLGDGASPFTKKRNAAS